jgi:hypothetical protein
MTPSDSEQMNQDISNMDTKSSSIIITSNGLRMNSNRVESADQMSADMDAFYSSNLDCTNNATIMVSSSSSAYSYISVNQPKDKDEIKNSEQENFQERDDRDLLNKRRQDVFFSDTSFIDKINLLEEHHHELRLKEAKNDPLFTELTLTDNESNKHDELEADLLDKIQEVRSVESAKIESEIDAVIFNQGDNKREQEMNPVSPIISIEMPSTILFQALKEHQSESKSPIDTNKPDNSQIDTSSLHFSFESITNSENKPNQSVVIDYMMENDQENNQSLVKESNGIQEFELEKRTVEKPSATTSIVKRGLFDTSIHQVKEPQALANEVRVVKFKEVTIVKTYNIITKSVFKEAYDSNNKLIKSELQDRSRRKELLTENKVTQFHSSYDAETSRNSNSIPSSRSQTNFEPTMQPIPNGSIKKSTSLLDHEASLFIANKRGHSNRNKPSGIEPQTKKNNAEYDEEERKSKISDEARNKNKLTKTNLKNKPKIKLGFRINKDVTSSSEDEREDDDLVYDQRTGRWIKTNKNATSQKSRKSTNIVTRSNKNSPLFPNAQKPRNEQESNKRTRFNSPSSFNQKNQPESKKQRNRLTSTQYFSFSDIRFKLTPEERRTDEAKTKESDKEQEQVKEKPEISKQDLKKKPNVVDQDQTKKKTSVDSVVSKTQIPNEIDSGSVERKANAIDQFMQEFSSSVASYINLSDSEEKNNTNSSSVAKTTLSTSNLDLTNRFKLKELTVKLDRLDESVYHKYMNKYTQPYTIKQIGTSTREIIFDHKVGDRVFVQKNEDFWLPAIVENKMSINVNNMTLVLYQCKFVNTNVEKTKASASNEAFSSHQLIPYDLFQVSDSLLVFDNKLKMYKSATLEEYESVQNEKLDESVLSYVVMLSSAKIRQT